MGKSNVGLWVVLILAVVLIAGLVLQFVTPS
ncbi:hypothetical protein SAMN05444972_10894 [Marininema halotolerans]|uniref:Uncharacterized protein n=1 Tax=Marininema halotolerans TaxID=1155944 RepID=A0A1I6SWS3_9BACL|nr:hypothetical protein SAMN05444972_10894 [Marininema halotolerans]